MALHCAPERFWCYGWEHTIRIRQFLCRNLSDRRPPREAILGDSIDVSEYMNFDFYQWIKYREEGNMPDKRVHFGRWLGIATNVGSSMCYWILVKSMKVIAQSSVVPLSKDDWMKPEYKDERKLFDEKVAATYGDYDDANEDEPIIDTSDEATNRVMFNAHITAPTDEMEEPVTGDFDNDEPLDEPGEGPAQIPAAKKPKQGEKTRRTDDNVNIQCELHNAEIFLPRGEHHKIARVIKSKKNAEGNYIGRKHKNPILDTRIFTVQFRDGEERDVTYNVLAEHLYSQVDSEGNQYQIFRGNINHRRLNNAIDKADQYTTNKSGRQIQRKTTTSWDFEIEWKDGSTSWIPLKELKNSNPVELAEYAKSNRIIEEPALDWWAPQTLKKKERMIKQTQRRTTRKGYQYGIKLPTTVDKALHLDELNGNTLCL